MYYKCSTKEIFTYLREVTFLKVMYLYQLIFFIYQFFSFIFSDLDLNFFFFFFFFLGLQRWDGEMG